MAVPLSRGRSARYAGRYPAGRCRGVTGGDQVSGSIDPVTSFGGVPESLSRVRRKQPERHTIRTEKCSEVTLMKRQYVMASVAACQDDDRCIGQPHAEVRMAHDDTGRFTNIVAIETVQAVCSTGHLIE